MQNLATPIPQVKPDSTDPTPLGDIVAGELEQIAERDNRSREFRRWLRARKRLESEER